MSGDRNVQVVVSLGCRCRQPSQKSGHLGGDLTTAIRQTRSPSSKASHGYHEDTYSAVSATGLTLASSRQSQDCMIESLLQPASSFHNGESTISDHHEFLKGHSFNGSTTSSRSQPHERSGGCIIKLPIMEANHEHNVTPTVQALSGMRFYIDPALSRELHSKIVEAAAQEGASCVEKLVIGGSRSTTHIICEKSSLAKYVHYEANIVTPLWVLRTVKEKIQQGLVHISSDLVRQLPLTLLGNEVKANLLQDINNVNINNEQPLEDVQRFTYQGMQVQERQAEMHAAKVAVRMRRGPQQQPCRTLPPTPTPPSLLKSIHWSITEPSSTAQILGDLAQYSDDLVSTIHSIEQHSMIPFDKQDISKKPILSTIQETQACTRSSQASQPLDIVYGGAFLTILFPIDRYSEMGPSSRSYFSAHGFTTKQILDHIHAFYEEYMSFDEVQTAMYTDSKHADILRAIYATIEAIHMGNVPMKRSAFIGSKKLFGGLKRHGHNNTCQIYELQLNVNMGS